jgi:hypothetical protein
MCGCFIASIIVKQTPWPESESELYRPSYHRLSAKLVLILRTEGAARSGWTDPYDRILGLLNRTRYYFFQVAPQLYSRSWMDPVPDALLLRKSGSARNRTRTRGSVVRNSDHYTIEVVVQLRPQMTALFATAPCEGRRCGLVHCF